MLYLLQNLSEKLAEYLKDDPVRPHIPYVERMGDNKDIFVLRDENDIAQAITCVSYQIGIPTGEDELFESSEEPDTAVFYTIWSYKPGAGRRLIFDAVKHIQENKTHIKRFVTLSPKTEMAKRFHTKKGAIVFRENTESTNYEYLGR
jgi:hypothetical protein